MKRLSLLRHAKSSWDSPSLEDFDRPLNERGRQAAKRMGRYMAERDLAPDAILCSPALRTRQTLDRVLQYFPNQPPVDFLESLYHAEPDVLLAAVKDAINDHLLLIGHNPGLHALAMQLAASPDSDRGALKRMAAKFPTGALASFTLDVSDWSEAGPANSVLTLFITPKALG